MICTMLMNRYISSVCLRYFYMSTKSCRLTICRYEVHALLGERRSSVLCILSFLLSMLNCCIQCMWEISETRQQHTAAYRNVSSKLVLAD